MNELNYHLSVLISKSKLIHILLLIDASKNNNYNKYIVNYLFVLFVCPICLCHRNVVPPHGH